MNYLIDTDRLAMYLKGRPEGIQVIDPLLKARESLAVSLITYGELYEGIYYGRDPKRNEQLLLQFLRPCRVIPLNRLTMRPPPWSTISRS